MELNQVSYFINLAETLNFTAAARLSGVSQPSLTRAIRRLEEELGGPLIYRDGKNSRLTGLGQDVELEFRRMLVAMKSVRHHSENWAMGRHRVLDVAVAPTVGPKAFTTFFDSALEEVPSIEIKLHSLQSSEDRRMSEAGRPLSSLSLCARTVMDARTEIISQVERRRRWSAADKVRLLEATMQPGTSVAAVADRHGVSRSLLFYWRKQAKAGLMPGVTPVGPIKEPAFAPVVVASEPSSASRPPPPFRKTGARAGCVVEIVLGNGRVLKVDEGIAPDRLAVLAAALDR